MSTTDIASGIPARGTGAKASAGLIDNLSERHDAPRQWTLKGLAPETVNVSREAARRSGMKLNAWVSRALEQAAGEDGSPSIDEKLPSPRQEEDAIQHIKEELVRLRAQSEDMRKTMDTMSSILLKLCAERI